MFGSRIKELREARNWTQVQLAKELQVSKQTVSNWENNYILPSVELLIRISELFSVSTDYLLQLNGREYLEISALTPKQLTHIRQLIDDFKELNEH